MLESAANGSDRWPKRSPRSSDELADTEAVRRLWARDHTLWAADPTEITDRLGWLDVAAEMAGAYERARRLRRAAAVADGLTDVVVMGMGGSSLFPEVLARSFPAGERGLRLHVLDSTDPAAVAHVAAHARTPTPRCYLASSKSGSTVETRSHLDFFWERVGRRRAASPSSPTPARRSAPSPASVGSARCSRTAPTSAVGTRR